MGQTLSEPITEKQSEEGGDDRFIYGLSSMQGWRISMEDAHTAVLRLEGDDDIAFFAVFDGHGGAGTAKFAGKTLHKRLAAEPAFLQKDYGAALKGAFLGADVDLRADPDHKHEPSGCTAVGTLISKERIVCGNAGDSRAVMSIGGTVKALSRDHKPTNDEESQRIVNAGGFVEFGRVNGNLALSRALGDFEFKRNSNLPPEQQIVTADPEIIDHSVDAEDEFVVIACDGIWDCMTSQEVVTAVRQEIVKKTPLAKICENIMDSCIAEDSDNFQYGCDNMTIIIVGLLHGRTQDEWYDWIATRTRLETNGSFSSATSTVGEDVITANAAAEEKTNGQCADNDSSKGDTGADPEPVEPM